MFLAMYVRPLAAIDISLTLRANPAAFTSHGAFVTKVVEAAAGGMRCVVLQQACEETATALAMHLPQDVALILDETPNVAGAAGVQVPFDAYSSTEVDVGAAVGLKIETPGELVHAEATLADYLTFPHEFKETWQLHFLKEWRDFSTHRFLVQPGSLDMIDALTSSLYCYDGIILGDEVLRDPEPTELARRVRTHIDACFKNKQ